MLKELLKLKNELESEFDLSAQDIAYLEQVTGLNKTLSNFEDNGDGALVALAWDAAIALGATAEQAEEYSEKREKKVELKPEVLTFTDGYVGSMGRSWKTPTAEMMTEIISGAMSENMMTEAEVVTLILSGKAVRWGKSPNYYYDHSDAVVKLKTTPKPQQLVRCDCGHSVPRALVMSSSTGTSCPDCYDEMSN